MNLRNWTVPVSAFLIAVSTPALAQQTAAPAGLYLSALGGAVFDPQTSATVGVEFGERIHPNVQAYAALSRFDNVMDGQLEGDLSLLSQTLTAVSGRLWDLRGRDRGVGFVAGARYLVGNGTLRPYVGGGAGVLNLRRTITDHRAGDVTAATFTDFGVGDSALATNSLTRPLIEATAGVSMELGRTHVDVGYRYRRALQVRRTVEFSQAVVGIGINF